MQHLTSSGCRSTSVTLILTPYAIRPSVHISNIYKRKWSELWLVHNPESCRSLFKQLEILPVLCQCILSLMDFIINNQGIFQIPSSIHSINTRNSIIVAVQLPNYLVFNKVHSILAQKCSAVYRPVWQSSRKTRQHLKQCNQIPTYTVLLPHCR